MQAQIDSNPWDSNRYPGIPVLPSLTCSECVENHRNEQQNDGQTL